MVCVKRNNYLSCFHTKSVFKRIRNEWLHLLSLYEHFQSIHTDSMVCSPFLASEEEVSVWPGTHCGSQADLELMIFLPSSPRHWNYSHVQLWTKMPFRLWFTNLIIPLKKVQLYNLLFRSLTEKSTKGNLFTIWEMKIYISLI